MVDVNLRPFKQYLSYVHQQYEILCAMELCIHLKDFRFQRESNPGSLDQHASTSPTELPWLSTEESVERNTSTDY